MEIQGFCLPATLYCVCVILGGIDNLLLAFHLDDFGGLIQWQTQFDHMIVSY